MYYAKLDMDRDGTVNVTFPDVPETITYGETLDEALAHARDALETALECYEESGTEFPLGKYRSKYPVHPRMLVAAKLELMRAMKAEGMTKYRLGKLLKMHPPQVDRLVSVKHKTRMDEVERALAAVGRQVWAKFNVTPLKSATTKTGLRQP